MILRCLLLVVWLVLIPTAAGAIVAAGVDKNKKTLPFLWISGQILLWAVFQVICVPFILKQKEFSKVVWVYGIVAVLLSVTGVVLLLWKVRSSRQSLRVIAGRSGRKEGLYYTAWAVFWLLLTFQLLQAVRMTYADGDDAFYVAVSTIAEESNTMYVKLPYTGGSTGLDARHGLAPFPIWIAFLARISGIKTVSVAHVAVPLVLLPMTYAVYYLIGRRICGKSSLEKLPLFLIFTELLVLFGDYSFYTAENFMIARSRQGKSALGNIILPMMLLVLLMLLEQIQEKQRADWQLWALLMVVVTAGCLCSTLGALLSCLLLGVTGLCAMVCYRTWKLLLPLAISCAPAVIFAVLYLMQD